MERILCNLRMRVGSNGQSHGHVRYRKRIGDTVYAALIIGELVCTSSNKVMQKHTEKVG